MRITHTVKMDFQRRLYLVFFLIFGSTLAVAEQTTTPIKVMVSAGHTDMAKAGGKQLQLSYPSSVRLEQILADSLANLALISVDATTDQQPVYSTGAGLFTQFPHPEKSNVLYQLEQLSLQADEDDKVVYQALYQALSEQPIGLRIFTPLDYDMVRIERAANPLITQDISLVLPRRPSTVLVLGAVSKPDVVAWQPRKTAEYYLGHVGSSRLANNSVATVIQPDGQLETHTIAYWNKNHRDIAPGATVYLGFSSLPSGYRSLNDEIINLLRNRAL
ncbi:capsule biosynthesis GfcC family protein [Photobacterium makurazakiensis]|uniref:capsule biosynthesis GfcC family protein n=1 Tax=Photobacterium makurazakiensis TaxID=2910234 RepID=UPI003D11B6EF